MRKIIILVLGLFAILLMDYIGGSLLLTGLNKSYGLNKHSKILIVGHSHLMMGLDRQTMETKLGCGVTKYTRSGVGMQERHLMVKQYMNSPYSDSLQLAILGVDPFSFNGKGLSSNCHTLFYPFMEEADVADYIKENTSWLVYNIHKLFRLTRYSDDLLTASVRGWKLDDRNYKTDTLAMEIMERRKNVWLRDIAFNTELMKEFEDCVSELTQKGIHVILLNTPISYILNQAHPKEYTKIMSYYKKMDESSNLIDFIDYNPLYEHDFSIFFDPVHLNVKGQTLITQEIIHEIKVRKLLK